MRDVSSLELMQNPADVDPAGLAQRDLRSAANRRIHELSKIYGDRLRPALLAELLAGQVRASDLGRWHPGHDAHAAARPLSDEPLEAAP